MTTTMALSDLLVKTCLLGAIYTVALASNGFGPVVQTRKGKVKGIRTTVRGKDIDIYYGIPYAKPPLGDLRFRHPVQNDDWYGIRNATTRPNSCWQGLDGVYPNVSAANVWDANTVRSEDCLYLNVWVPRTNLGNGQKKSVLVWIFGGGFFSGSSTLDIYDAKYIAVENDIIVVSMQYRVGALGFLSLFHREAPGNSGMFDQVMSLEWVQQNINAFGGDRNEVTLMGESAGAVSVGMHMMSPLSRGKFKRVILQSGAPHAAWAVLPDKEAKLRSLKLAKDMSCAFEEMHEVAECLRQQSAEEFSTSEWSTITFGVVRFPFVPIVDGSFLTESPEKSLRTQNFKKCPVLLGHNTNEANYWLMYFNQELFPLHSEPQISETSFNQLIEDLFRYHPYYPKRLNTFGLEAIKFHYRNWINPGDQRSNAKQLDNAVGDFNFICPTIDFAQHVASAGSNVFYYVFDHRSSTHGWPMWTGILHGDEINFVFGEPFDTSKAYTHEEKMFTRKIMRYWTNFAKTGNPNKAPGEINMDEWPLYDNTTRKHLILKPELINRLDKSLAIQQGSRVNECMFWKEYLPSLVIKSEETCTGERPCPITDKSSDGRKTAPSLSIAMVVPLILLWRFCYID